MLYKVMREGEIWASDSSSFLQIFWRMKSKKGSSLWKLKASVNRSSLSVRTAGRSSSWWGIHPQAKRTGFADSMEFMHQQDHRIHIFLCKIPVPVKSVNLIEFVQNVCSTEFVKNWYIYISETLALDGWRPGTRVWASPQSCWPLCHDENPSRPRRYLFHPGVESLSHIESYRHDVTGRLYILLQSYLSSAKIPFWLWSNLPSKFLFEVS